MRTTTPTARSLDTASFLLLFGCLGCGDAGTKPNTTANDTLDTNEDGKLSDEDLKPGQAAIELLYTSPAGGSGVQIRHLTSTAFIYFDSQGLMCPPGWGLKIPVKHVSVPNEFAVFLWFQDADSRDDRVSTGDGAVFVVSVDVPAIEHGGRAEGGSSQYVTVSSSTPRVASGWYEGSAEVVTAFYSPGAAPSGETFLVRRIAYRDVPSQKPSGQTSCSDDDGGMGRSIGGDAGGCAAKFKERCFASVAAACAYADCDRDCNVRDSVPAVVLCE